jgi:hypothetical protein
LIPLKFRDHSRPGAKAIDYVQSEIRQGLANTRSDEENAAHTVKATRRIIPLSTRLDGRLI